MPPIMHTGISIHRRKILESSPDKALQLLLVLACGALYLWWAYHLPVDLAPDEDLRLRIPFFIFDHGSLPTIFDAEAYAAPFEGSTYAAQPFGSSLVAVAFMKLMSLAHNTPTALVFAARCSSVLFGMLTVFILLRIGRRAFKNPAAKFFMALFVGLLPQFAFLSSYMNCDMMAICSSTMIVWCWFRARDEGWTNLNCALLGVAVGLCALSYYNAYGTILAAFGLLLFDTVKDGRDVGRLIVRRFGIAIVVCLLLCGWFFVRNMVLYQGDALGLSARGFVSMTDSAATAGAATSGVLDTYIDMLFHYQGRYSFSESWIALSYMSSIGDFGYMTIRLPAYLYYAYSVVLLVGIVPGLYALVGVWRKRKMRSMILALGLCLIIPLMLSLYFSYSVYQPQGRYLFPGLPALALLVTLGYDRCVKFVSRRPSRGGDGTKAADFTGALFAVCMAAYVILFVIVLLKVIIPLCTGSLLDETLIETYSSLYLSF